MPKRLEVLRSLSELDHLITSARDLDELARAAVRHICAICQCEVALLLQKSRDGEMACWSSAPAALPELLIPGLPARISADDPAGRALERGETVIVSESAQTTIVVPLNALAGEKLGVLQLRGDLFPVDDQIQIATLETLTRRLALGVANLKTQRALSEQAARLQTLQQLTTRITATLEVTEVYRAIYDSARVLMDCDAFFIALHDEKNKVYDYVLRADDGVIILPARTQTRQGLTGYVIQTRHPVNIPDTNGATPFEIMRWGGARKTQSLLCVPMLLGDRALGALSAQSYRRNAYSAADLETLSIFAGQAAVAINNARLFDETQRKVKQLAVLNEVGRIVSSTMEMDRLFDLIYDQVCRVLPSDTYYVALADLEKRVIELKVIVDDGERFPPREVPLGEGLASLVIHQSAPLLLNNLPDDYNQLGIHGQILGKPRHSASWLGVPMMTSEHVVGVLAVASYQPGVFDGDDLEILQNVATQAAIAIDNARHHREAVEQSRRDSLTQVLNHGYFLTRLGEEVERAQTLLQPLAAIMLDIDHFKEYNDTYGHLAGDAILRGTVQAIRANIEQTDLVGRWGGEEFAIALLQTNARDAHAVAERIRATLASVKMVDDQARAIPVPTVSQGIATLPDDANDAIALIDLADKRLYRAKARGRDQISAEEAGD